MGVLAAATRPDLLAVVRRTFLSAAHSLQKLGLPKASTPVGAVGAKGLRTQTFSDPDCASADLPLLFHRPEFQSCQFAAEEDGGMRPLINGFCPRYGYESMLPTGPGDPTIAVRYAERRRRRWRGRRAGGRDRYWRPRWRQGRREQCRE